MQLKASKRELLGKRSRRLHREGKLAAVVYGHSAEPTPLVLDRLEFQKVFIKSGRTHLVDLVVDGAKTEKVLVREIQTHPRRLGPIHVDFYQVSLEEKIRVEVPVHLIGESAAVKRGDADILQPIHALEVECLPTDIPEEFEVDLGPLADIDAEARPADLSVAAGAYRRALDLAESLHMRPLVAQCLLGLARLHRQAGERDQARKGLADAIARFSTMGMTLWVERAQADLDA